MQELLLVILYKQHANIKGPLFIVNNLLKYVFWWPIFQPHDLALLLTGKGGYVTKDKINATINELPIDNKIVTFDIGILPRIATDQSSKIDHRWLLIIILYNIICWHRRWPISNPFVHKWFDPRLSFQCCII